MQTVNATTLINGALRAIGVLGEGETPSNAEYNDALLALNDLIDAWAIEPLMIYFMPRTVTTLTSGKSSYTIGTGGNINIVRPERLEAAGLIIDLTQNPQTELPIDIFTDQDWQGIRQKTLGNPYAKGIYYDRNIAGGLGTIYPWPIPNVSNTQLVLYTLQALVAFTDLVTNYTFPAGYARAIRLGLAIELADEFGRTPSAVLTGRAQLAKGRIKIANANARPIVALLDEQLPGKSRGNIYDWRTDSQR